MPLHYIKMKLHYIQSHLGEADTVEVVHTVDGARAGRAAVLIEAHAADDLERFVDTVPSPRRRRRTLPSAAAQTKREKRGKIEKREKREKGVPSERAAGSATRSAHATDPPPVGGGEWCLCELSGSDAAASDAVGAARRDDTCAP